jgi:hypothetical protein
MQQKLNWRRFGTWLLLGVTLVLLTVVPLRTSADTTSNITVPTAVPAGMQTPSTAGGGLTTGFRTALNWNDYSATPTTAQKYAYLESGNKVTVKTSFSKPNPTTSVTYTTYLKVGDGAVSTSPTSATNDPANSKQSNVAVNFGTPSGIQGQNDVIGYELTAPTVSQPTWVYFQVMVHESGLFAGNYYTSVFPMLVLPKDYKPTMSYTPAVVFRGGSATATPSVTTNGFTLGLKTTTPSASTGSWAGTTFTAAGVGTTSGAFSVTVPATSAGTTAKTYTTDTKTLYIGDIADQSAFVGNDATFTVQLPDGLTAKNVRWKGAGLTQNGDSSSFTIPSVTMAMFGAQITATMDVYQGDTMIQKDATGTATLTTIDSLVKGAVTPQLVFSGSNVPNGMNQAQGKVTGMSGEDLGAWTTWSSSDPSLASVDANGKLTANTTGKTGMVNLIGNTSYVTKQFKTTQPVTVARLAQPSPLAVGSTATLTAPNAPSGTNWTYQWQMAAAGSTNWTDVGGATGATYTTPSLTMDNDQQQYRVVVTMADGTTKVTSNPVTLTVNAGGLALREVPSFNFRVAQDGKPLDEMTDPTVQSLINGDFDGSTTDFTNPDIFNKWMLSDSDGNIGLSDTRSPAGQDYQLSVAMTPFKTAAGQLSAGGGTAKVLLYWIDSSGNPVIGGTIPDNNTDTTVMSNQPVNSTTGRLDQQVSALLSVGKSPRAVVGHYTSTMTWTLTSGPDAN